MIISSIFFIRYLRSISILDFSNKIYFKFYFKYLIISSIVYLVGVVSLFVATVKCFLDEPDDSFEAIVTICNVTRILAPVMVLGVMVNHPELKMAGVLRYFTRCCSSQP